MNILYVSALTGYLFAGPNNSVPAQIKAQSAFDNVFWYNLNHTKRPEWSDDGLDCKNLDDYPSGRLRDLPAPFNAPDLAVIEQLYNFPFCKLILDLQKKKIPYIIIPRGVMTVQAQKKKALKKIIGNLLWFNSMVYKATAVQYLTREEYVESCERWKVKSFIIPNGIAKQNEITAVFAEDNIKGTYIGRFESYQKGLDLLLSAVAAEQKLLRESGFILNMYGHDQENSLEALKKQAEDLNIQDLLEFHGAVFGDEKRMVLLNTDVFIMTSRFEGHPMGMLEALSYGLPCVATVGTNLSEEIKEYDAGWTAANDVASIRNALRNMINEKDLLKAKGGNAVRLADVYSWDEIAKQSHEAYAGIVKESKNEPKTCINESNT